MADENNILPECFKEAVCIDAGRVYDSCCDRDCLEDLRCYFSEDGQTLVNTATSVRVRSAEIVKVYVDVTPVNFNRGYYSCDLTFFFVLDFDLFTTPQATPSQVKGAAVYSKKVILYGSEGNVKVFSNLTTSESETDCVTQKATNMPRCVVQCIDPIALSAKLGETKENFECYCTIPQCVYDSIGGNITEDNSTAVFVTLGLFSIVQIIRNVQMLIPVYDFCMPEKRCDDSTDNPCDIFKRIQFPTNDFFPPKTLSDEQENSGCGCGAKN